MIASNQRLTFTQYSYIYHISKGFFLPLFYWLSLVDGKADHSRLFLLVSSKLVGSADDLLSNHSDNVEFSLTKCAVDLCWSSLESKRAIKIRILNIYVKIFYQAPSFALLHLASLKLGVCVSWPFIKMLVVSFSFYSCKLELIFLVFSLFVSSREV